MRIAVIHPNIMCAGGAEVTGLMTLEYCQDLGDVDFITDNNVDFDVLNEKFSTHIRPVKIRVVRPLLCRLIGKLEPRIHLFAKLQLTLFSRYVKKHYKEEDDLIISTKQEADFGKPGIQFLHHPPDGLKTKFYDGAYLWVLAKLGRSKKGIMQNLTISPSIYIKRLYDDTYWTNKSYVLYPAIRKCPIEQTEWNKRENGFIIVGHIDKLKGTDKAIELIDRVRRTEMIDGIRSSGLAGSDLHLHIIGTGEGSYFRAIQRMAKDREYVYMEGFVSTEEYFKLLTSHKYGLHMRKDEPSAVTVRELVDCGEIVFAHDSGGTPEILNYNKDLLFKDEEDADYKISRVTMEDRKHTMPESRVQERFREELKKIKFNTRDEWKEEFKKLMGGLHGE